MSADSADERQVEDGLQARARELGAPPGACP